MSRQAMQQALEALDGLHGAYRRAVGLVDRSHDDSATIAAHNAGAALRQALAEPEQEPVPWEQFYPDIGKPQTTHWEGCEAVHPECKKQEPVAWMESPHGAIRANRNYPFKAPASVAPWNIPLYMHPPTPQHDTDCHAQGICQRSGYSLAPTPPRKPVDLTDDEIALIVAECSASAYRADDFSFARAVIAAYERKNGIGEQT